MTSRSSGGPRPGQALDNLLSKALRYSPDASEIVVAARTHEGGVEIAVTDQGPGLTEEQRSQVFERFYRVDPSRSRALGGSGIGLAIPRALVQLMDGRVWAESSGPGLGSTFRILDRKSTRLNSSHSQISYAVFCL